MFVFDDPAPQIYFTVDSVPPVLCPAQVLRTLRCVHAAAATFLGSRVSTMCWVVATGDVPNSKSPTPSYEWRIGKPGLAIERLETISGPLPHAIPDNRRDVIGSAHQVAGTCPASGAGSGFGGAG
jgi:hypothetical protein